MNITNECEKESKVMVRFRIDDELRKALKIYATRNNSSIQEIMEQLAIGFLTEKGIVENEN